jgi:hypothetical protein
MYLKKCDPPIKLIGDNVVTAMNKTLLSSLKKGAISETL